MNKGGGNKHHGGLSCKTIPSGVIGDKRVFPYSLPTITRTVVVEELI